MKMTIEIPDTFSKDEVILKKDLIKFVNEYIDYYKKEVNSNLSESNRIYKDRVQGALTCYVRLKEWIEDYEI